MSFAIYEVFALIISLPLSYAMAWVTKLYSSDTYKDEVDRLFAATWTGDDDDELNAWLKVKRIYDSKKAPKKKGYILKKIHELDKHRLLSSFYIDEKGVIKRAKELKTSN